jgi:hypothetical protein
MIISVVGEPPGAAAGGPAVCPTADARPVVRQYAAA